MENIIKLESNAQIIQGYLYGLKNSSILISMIIKNNFIDESFSKNILLDINSFLINKTDISEKINLQKNLDFFSYTFLECIYLLQKSSYWPIFERGLLIEHSKESLTYRFAIPAPKKTYRALIALILEVVELMNASIKNENKQIHLVQIKKLIEQFKKIKTQSTNIPHFLKTAHALEIPFKQIQDTLYQYGYGRELRWLDSTFTDETRFISSKIARNKNLTSLILRESGFPVAKQRIIKDPKDAISFAKEFGFPVVIKPYNLDGGVGVSIGLNTENEIIDAYKKASKFSNKIIVENHISGRDYRLVVFNGKLIWAIERLPACVIGNGLNSIEELVELENKNPHRGDSDEQPLQPLVLDEDALKLIKTSGYNIESIPKDGEYVFLRLHANISSGGIPITVFDKIHEDNKILAINVAEALRLDLSGIDLIMHDISKSWKEIGATICEVNAQPMLGSLTSLHLYEIILKEMLPKFGRIPIIAVIGLDESKFIEQVIADLKRHEIYLIKIDSESHTKNNSIANIYAKTLSALNNHKTQGIIIHITESSILKTGLPCQYIDALILSGSWKDSANENNNSKTFATLLGSLTPMSKNDPIFIDSELQSELIKRDFLSAKRCTIKEALNTISNKLVSFYSL